MASTYTQPNFATKVTTGNLSADGNTLTEFPGWSGVSVDNIRRTFAIGDYVNQLAPEQSLFFTYLSRVAKSTLDETVWKPMEYRPQWQRRNFRMFNEADNTAECPLTVEDSGAGVASSTAVTAGATAKGWLATLGAVDGTSGLQFFCNYNNVGKKTTAWDQAPIFLLVSQIVRLKVKYVPNGGDAVETYENFKLLANAGSAWEAVSVRNDFPFADAGDVYTVMGTNAAPAEGQVVGSAFAEASTAPDGWSDQISDTEFYMQIFKTSVPLMSGSAQATKYRGFADEYSRIYTQHVLSHKMDIEHAMLFGHGNYVSQDERYSWGIVPFIEAGGGKVYEINASSAGFDYFVDLMRDFFDYESGNSGQKLVLTSRSVIAWLTKMGTSASNSFVFNTLGMGESLTSGTNAGTNSPYGAQVDIKQSKFAPVPITAISTAFGTLNFVAHPLFRGHADGIAAVIDMNNVKYRCLSGNGVNRDTFVETNIQDNSVDGRKDQIITECGLEVALPETHALLKFTNLSNLIPA
tara:strand:+ start:76 stop:1638 length:1563 start_codon:yes stop_codon:yes gene_type:complete